MSVPAEYSKQLNMPEGVYVSEIKKAGGAEAAGMTKGSVITAIDGTTVSSMDDLQEQLQYYAKGDKVLLTIQIPQRVMESMKRNSGSNIRCEIKLLLSECIMFRDCHVAIPFVVVHNFSYLPYNNKKI